MHSFLKKPFSVPRPVPAGGRAAGATTLTGLETETVERDWESSLFFPAHGGADRRFHGRARRFDETQYANLIAAMAQGNIPADVLFKANLRAQEQILLKAAR